VEDLELETAMDMIAERVITARERGWQDHDREGRRVNRRWGLRTWVARRSTTRRTT
jgi:formate dehydrogenase major subunit